MQNNGTYATKFTWNLWQGVFWKHFLVPTEPNVKAQQGK